MKSDIVLAGVGGQGILTIAAIVARVAMHEGLNVKQSEVHGMSQRGGSVVAHLRLADTPIFSDLIAPAGADVILAMEPMEALRHAAFLAPDGAIITNATPIVNIGDYPELEQLHQAINAYPRHLIVTGEAIAKDCGSPRAVNMVLLGALTRCLPLADTLFADAIREAFARKGAEIVEANLKAYRAGLQAAAAI